MMHIYVKNTLYSVFDAVNSFIMCCIDSADFPSESNDMCPSIITKNHKESKKFGHHF
jgi:hypothetical protein